MSILHRYILTTAFSRWAMVLFLGVFLIMLGDFVGSMGTYLGALVGHRAHEVMLYFLLRFPQFMAIWLPLSVAVAGLLTVTPMLRQGTLIALLAAGVAPRRIFASLIGLALAVGLLGLVLQDQIIPRLASSIPIVHARMEGVADADHDEARSVGWRESDHFWCVQTAKPDEADYQTIAIFSLSTSGRPGSTVMADRLYWKDRQWWLKNVVLIHAVSKPYAVFANRPLAALGLHLNGDPAALASRLTLDAHKTSDELVAAKARMAWSMIALRIAFGLLPLLCLLSALPGFIRLEGRTGLGTMVGKALLMAMLPLGFFWLLSRVLVANGSHALPSCIIGVSLLLTIGLWRWWRMRL